MRAGSDEGGARGNEKYGTRNDEWNCDFLFVFLKLCAVKKPSHWRPFQISKAGNNVNYMRPYSEDHFV